LLQLGKKGVDGRDEPGHDENWIIVILQEAVRPAVPPISDFPNFA
jgi:hypothetical protein